MSIEYDKMQFFDYARPALTGGHYRVTLSQQVTQPQSDSFGQQEDFYVAEAAYTLAADRVFSTAPSENECEDFSQTIPFITVKDKTLPWNYKIAGDINGAPVPWLALLVISSAEPAEEKDISLKELLEGPPPGVYFPEGKLLPELTTEKEDTLCHVVDLPRDLYLAIRPSLEDMVLLTHGMRVNLADTEDKVAALDGDFAVIMANRFIPTGDGQPLESSVHLVSMLGRPETVAESWAKVRLVSLYRFKVFSLADNSETFAKLVDNLSQNTGVMAFDQSHELRKRGFVPKKHYTRSGELTCSLYRSPLLPYENSQVDCSSKATADGHLIYDPDTGLFDVSYAVAFQTGRLLALSHGGNARKLTAARQKRKTAAHKRQLAKTLGRLDVPAVMGAWLKDK